MRLLNYLFVSTIVLLLASCGASKQEEPKKNLPPKEEYMLKVKEFEAEMHKAVEIDNTIANNAITLYTEFALYFPEDTIAPEYLFKAGEVATAAKKYKRALDCYENILMNYPDYKHYRESMYLKAFLLDNFLNDDVAAKVVYKEVIKKFPETNYAKDAKAAIENLGKTDEQIIEEIKKKNKEK
jgi:outer membrane protein assembly factor BamD (BamD/ComL family)